MNKLIILIIMVVSFGIIATQAIAGDVLSAADFFYGVTINNTVAANNAADHQKQEAVTEASTDLSPAAFFYGEAIGNAVVINNKAHLQEKRDVAAPAINLMAPENFYGYTNTITDVDKCKKC